MEATNIKDFGQKIGGAKKDLARQQLDRIKQVTDDALITQPLSKVFPRPDFTKMFREGQITADEAIIMQYLYNLIPNKPRNSYGVRRWAAKAMAIIAWFNVILNKSDYSGLEEILHSEKYQSYKLEMDAANWPHENYNPYPYKVCKSYYGLGDYMVAKGQRIQKRGTLQECVDWVKEQSSTPRKENELQCTVYYFPRTGEYFITPKGKKNVILKRDFPSGEAARAFIRDNHPELKKAYDTIRLVPEERRKWNRPRVGCSHRLDLDISPERFSETFPFRGVEFGNWLNQVDRSASLNDGFDALMDLALALDISPSAISLNNQLALAFGARGSGKASAHYESLKRVINLTKTRGAGSLAHEWFHAMDNFVSIQLGSPLSFASDICRNSLVNEVLLAFLQLRDAINKTDFRKRSEECDKFRSKPYWGTMIEMCARGFEKYIIVKLETLGWHNDYLANICSQSEYGNDDKYPYPTDEENKVLTPFYDAVIQVVSQSLLTLQLQTA